jgi:hypothetical protein|tara:strand:- start:1425 stop:2192 length:768 start_codon:yes stop_codon:yes gene_type:complete
MITKLISKNTEVLYDSVDEFREYYPDASLRSEWRKSDKGDWIITDDMKVCKVLYRGIMVTSSGRETGYIRTILGTFTMNPGTEIGGKPPKNIYSFSNNKFSNPLRKNRKNPTSNEFIFAKYVAKGLDPAEAYLKVFPTKNREYAKTASRGLLKTERIKKLVTEEIESILSDIGASKHYLLEMTKNIIDNVEGRDGDKLRAIELMMKIAGMFPNEKKTESLTVFQGFTEEQLKRINKNDVKALAYAEREIEEESDS